MHLDTKDNEIIRNFIGPANNGDYTIKIMVFEKPLAKTMDGQEIYSGAFIEDKIGEIKFRMLFPVKLSGEEMIKQANYMVENVVKILEDSNNG